MPTARYTALSAEADHEDHAPPRDDMEAAFDYSDDEDDDQVSESHPLNPTPTSPTRFNAPAARTHTHGTYDFERMDYDYPPPGSPPLPSATALPNDIGNSNGFVPSSNAVPHQPNRNWFQRSAAAILPDNVAQRIGILPQRPSGPVGGGTNNDGVFANVTAKPTRPIRIQEGDDTYVVPEDSRSEAPPSYAAAQADAVPTYWETTVHAPFAPGMEGEIMVDSLPTGSLFSFLWNMLVSISFQFVGFLLTYLLHTTHAARLGSRAGLGVTLIQYGFALRTARDNTDQVDSSWGGWEPAPARPSDDGTSAYGIDFGNATMSGDVKSLVDPNPQLNEATQEWLSFFLMTVGWFILLTSLLGYWRVKRWERSILASQRDNSTTSPAVEARPAISFPVFSRMENTFSLQGQSRIDLLRAGFGFGNRQDAGADDPAARRAEEGLPLDPNNPQHREMLENDRRLERNLRDAGFI